MSQLRRAPLQRSGIRRSSLWLLIALAVLAPTLPAEAGSRLRINGYMAPSFNVTLRPGAREVDFLDVGIGGSQAGLIFQGRPVDHWRFKIDLVIGADLFQALASVDLVDTDNDGDPDRVSSTTVEAISNIVEETTITWAPADQFSVRLGRLRIPFTSQSQSHFMTLMFPSRAEVNEVFLRGTDLGGLGEFNLGDGRFRSSIGLFNGTNLAVGSGNIKGVLITGRIDLNPLGDFEFGESRVTGGPFRLGIGAGLVYNPYNSYDSAGVRDVLVNDLRACASLRMAAGGLYWVTEGLFRRQVDSLTDRPLMDTGAYTQLGVYVPAGVEPVLRVGWAGQDLSFGARHTVWAEGGLNLYPARNDEDPNSVKFGLLYLGEFRLTEREFAHGAAVRAQVSF